MDERDELMQDLAYYLTIAFKVTMPSMDEALGYEIIYDFLLDSAFDEIAAVEMGELLKKATAAARSSESH